MRIVPVLLLTVNWYAVDSSVAQEASRSAAPSSEPIHADQTLEGGTADVDRKLSIDARPDAGVFGVFALDAVELRFRASVNDGWIDSSIALANGTIITSLRVPDVTNRVVPGLPESIREAAVVTAEILNRRSATLGRPQAVERAIDELAQGIFEHTSELRGRQLRYALAYHTSILKTAIRMDGNTSLEAAIAACTPSETYEFGDAPFRCMQDWEPERRLGSAAPNIQAGCENGSDICCCGNYSGPCWYCAVACCLHDVACLCCTWWWCGWSCVPESVCGIFAIAAPGTPTKYGPLLPRTTHYVPIP